MVKELKITERVPLRGVSLVEASAGTGKTYSIAKLFLQAVLDGNDIREILVVTFTEAATKELKARIRKELYDFEKYLAYQLDPENHTPPDSIDEYTAISAIFAEHSIEKQLELVRNALLSIDLAAIHTIHGFCQRMLIENAFESRIAFGAELLTDTSELIEEIARNFWRKNFLNISKIEKKILEKIDITALTKLVKIFIENRDVELSNKAPMPFSDIKLSINKIYDELIQELNSCDLESELLSYYSDIAKNMKYAFHLNKYEETVAKCMKHIRTGNYNIKEMTPLFKNDVESKISAPAKKKGFDLPDAKFFAIGKSVKEIEPLKKFMKSALFEELFHYANKEFEEIKNKRHILTFNDLIYKLYNVIRSESENSAAKPLTRLIRSKFRIALVDEFQDTDRHQYYIFNEVFGKSSKHAFFMIGDPKQSIYKFRGADILSYLKAKNDAQFEYTLLKNFRSEPAMIEGVNHIFNFKQTFYEELEDSDIQEDEERGIFVYSNDSTGKDGIPFHSIQPGSKVIPELITGSSPDQALQMIVVTDTNKDYIKRNCAQHLTNEIVNLLTEAAAGKNYFKYNELRREINPGDIAVLVHNHKQAALIKKSLSKASVPAVIQNSAGIFQSAEAHDIKIWLKALKKPVETNIRPLFVTNILKKTFSEIDNSSSKYILTVSEEFMRLQQQWQEIGFAVAFRSFMEKFGTLESALKLANGERIVTNYFQLTDLIHQHELNRGRNIDKTLSYIQKEIEQPSTEDIYLEQLETDKTSVNIMTIHKSKGLEFPIVFCPYLWDHSITAHEQYYETLLLNEERGDKTVKLLDLKADETLFKERIIQGRKEILAEHIRLLYVALTRAASRIYLYIGDDQALGKSAFTYIFTDNTTAFLASLPSRKSKLLTKYHEQCLLHIEEFAEKHSDVVSRQEVSGYIKPAKYIEKKSEQSRQFKIRELRRSLSQTWSVSSFSALISKAEYHSDPIKRGSGTFGLPSGKKFGSAIHKIFENYYNYGEALFYDHKIRKYRFEDVLKRDRYFKSNDAKTAEDRFKIVEEMVQAALNANITVDNISLTLKDITKKDAKPEFSFYHKVATISPNLLSSLFANFATGMMKDFAAEIIPLDFIFKHGYMSGEIDLFFRYNNRYFVLDWKSNHLGADFNNYSPEKIEEDMYKHYYLLQAHIYSLAAHLFLKQNMANYDYDTHFGGFIYVYTRGVDAAGNGIYSNKPPKILIEKMEQLIVSGKGE